MIAIEEDRLIEIGNGREDDELILAPSKVIDSIWQMINNRITTYSVGQHYVN
jgi:hypothetical protein